MSQPPDKGQMYLFDSVTPPLQVGSYQVTAETDVTFGGNTQSYTQPRYFDVVGPRFSVPQAMVAGVFPPANSHGSFQDSLPHIVLTRRTLPWERDPDPTHKFPAQVTLPGEPPLADGPTPWVALLLFEEGEYTYYNNIPLQQAVPAAVFQRMGSPTGITCDAVEASKALVESILPAIEELKLLAHARWVNVDDRELNIAGGDGYFSVVVSNRLPSAGAQCRAVLVSLEERADLVAGDPGKYVDTAPLAGGNRIETTGSLPAPQAGLVAASATPSVTESGGTVLALNQVPALRLNTGKLGLFNGGFVQLDRVRLVALTSWKFTCDGPGTFETLMQGLDVAMFGTVAETGHPPLSDTGHLQLTLQDRAGGTEQVWYRGPLVQYQLTRDPLGPYHCADQARRVTPETGAEDISYAAAFEVGRLLAAADPRLAQSLMRWRREAYKQSARTDTLAALAARLPMNLPVTLADRLHTPIAPLAAAAVTASVVQSGPVLADAHGLTQIGNLPGQNPNTLATAWQLASPAEAAGLLTGVPSLGAAVTPGPATARPATTLATVAADAAGLARLSAQRNQTLQNAVSKLENP